MKSTLLNMVLVLFVITLISATTLGLVYDVTEGPIAAAKIAKTTNALAQVMPKFDNDPTADTVTYMLDELPIKVYKGMLGGAVSGYAVEAATKNGFSGEIKMMMGLKPDGEIVTIEVLQHKETPGLGSKMAEPGNVLLVSFQGKNPKDLKMAVRKDGGDIDAITASTISSRAYVDAVERGYKAFELAVSGGIPEPAAKENYFALVMPKVLNLTEPKIIMAKGIETKVVESYSDAGIAGYAVESSAKGHNGPIRLMVGFTSDSEICNIVVIEHREDRVFIEAPDNVIAASLIGKKAADVTADSKNKNTIVEAISGATITSQAYFNAIKTACVAYQMNILEKQRYE